MSSGNKIYLNINIVGIICDIKLSRLITFSEDVEEEAKEDDNINWLSPINYVTRIGLEITVTLSKQAHSEECYLRTPEGNTLIQSTEGVNFYDSSDFVSCRVVIGPMDQNLLGKWALCGKYIENNVKHERCQTANINWSKYYYNLRTLKIF